MLAHIRIASIALAVGGILLAGTDVVQGQCQANEFAKLTASDAAESDLFGVAVDIHDNTAVIGARYDDDSGNQSGSAYVFQYDGLGWAEEAKLLASDGYPNDSFGVSVAIHDDIILIGANDEDEFGPNSGAAYLFRWDNGTWTEEVKLTASNASSGAKFGNAVSIFGNTAVVGVGAEIKSAYVFRYDGNVWIEEAILVPSDPQNWSYFGHAVSISGDIAVVGAEGVNAAYIFRFDGQTWIEETILTVDGSPPSDRFGSTVAVYGETVVVGDYEDDENGIDAGAVYVFGFDGSLWQEEAKLMASDGAPGDYFGWSISTNNGRIAVGAYSDDGGGNNSGSAYLYHYSSGVWSEEAKLTASDGAEYDNLGYSVGISGGLVLAGARGCDDNGDDSGAAYVFGSLLDCNESGTVDICDIANGTSVDCNENGMPDECDIANGTSVDVDNDGIPDDCEPDCNTNGVPDDHDITSGTSEDCNENGIPDECDIASGFSEDCDTDGVPDDCVVLFFSDTSSQLEPLGDGVPQSYAVTAPPVAGAEVELLFEAIGDLWDLNEYVTVDINGVLIGHVFAEGASDCPTEPDIGQLAISADTYNAAMNGGDAVIGMVASPAVNPAWCPESYIVVTLQYQAITAGDCNASGLPDLCDIALGYSEDLNGNGIPDECESSLICSGDSNCDGAISWRDIDYFVAAMNDNVAAWEAMFAPGSPSCPFLNNDVNEDSTVNWRDIDPFVAAMNTTCP